MPAEHKRRAQAFDPVERGKPKTPVFAAPRLQIRPVQAHHAIARIKYALLRNPDGEVGARVSRREEHLRSYAAQIEDGFFAELLVRRGQLRAMEEGMGFLALAAQAVESGIVEHGNLGRKLLGGSLILGVSVDVDSEVAKEAIAADMIEVLLGVHSQDSIAGTNRASVAMNRLRRHPVCAGVDDERGGIARHKAGIDAPRREVSEPGHGITMWRNLHETLSLSDKRIQRPIHSLRRSDSPGASHEQAVFHFHRWLGHRQPRSCRLGSHRYPRNQTPRDRRIGPVVNRLRNGTPRRGRGTAPNSNRCPNRTAL